MSPFLFTLYTADCRSTHDECQTDKFASDTAQIGQITDDDDRVYLQVIADFVQWCDDNFLELNVGKTEEMIIDFRKNGTQPNPVIIKGVEVERVNTHKHLGVVFDKSLNWKEHKHHHKESPLPSPLLRETEIF